MEMIKQILTTTLLLVSSFTFTNAQNRSAKENLAGLREIGVVVKYANVDGLETAKQPTVLQTLQDQAKARLKLAEIPVLESPEESDLAGTPRLIFTVTANKPANNMATIVVQTSLNERVRLWRDDTKEMELGTWVQSGFGYAPKVTTQMLSQVFNSVLDEFIKDYRDVNPKPTVADGGTAVPVAQVNANVDSLQGLNGIKLFVWSGPSGSPPAPLAALIKMAQSEADKKFREAGIPLLKYGKEIEEAGQPLLYISFKMNQPVSYAPAIEVEGKFWQQVRPLRDLKQQIHAVTWESQTNKDGQITDEAVLQVISAQIDEFIKAYRAANPLPVKGQVR